MTSHTQRDDGELLEGGDGTIDDLKQALVENLEHRGVLGKLRAKVRAEVFHTLEGSQEGLLQPPLSNENLLINELVRDYLSFNGYANALGVFMAESGQPSDRSLDRAFLRDELGLIERRDISSSRDATARPLPLLYGITSALKRKQNEACSQESVCDEEEEEEKECGGVWRTIGETETRTDNAIGTSSKKKGSRPGINWTDPAPVVFTRRSVGRSGGGGGGQGGGSGGDRSA
ncbi:unnamed protein product [Pylaiella littoralis]